MLQAMKMIDFYQFSRVMTNRFTLNEKA